MATIDEPLSAEDLTDARSLLREAPYAYVASVEEQGPYVLPMNFAYAEDRAPRLAGTIYFHTGEGRKTAAWAADARVCVAVTGNVGFIQGDSPCRDGFAYRSLLVWGTIRPVEPKKDRSSGLRKGPSRDWSAKSGSRPAARGRNGRGGAS